MCLLFLLLLPQTFQLDGDHEQGGEWYLGSVAADARIRRHTVTGYLAYAHCHGIKHSLHYVPAAAAAADVPAGC
jgi:hypothetical protein